LGVGLRHTAAATAGYGTNVAVLWRGSLYNAGELERRHRTTCDPEIQRMQDLIGLVICCGTPLVVCAIPAAIINWTLGPLLRRAGAAAGARRFLLSDLFWLLAYLQVAMGVAAFAFPAELPTRQRVGALLLLCLAAALFWLAAVRGVSEAKVQRTARRAVVFLVVLPATVIAMIALPLLLLWAAWSATAPEVFPQRGAAVASLSCVLLTGGLVVLRGLAAWSVESESPWREALGVAWIQSLAARRRGG
jgi:hypothetical protein